MDWEINLTAGLVAGVAAMVPGAIIYAPGVLGNRWMKEIGTTPEKMKAAGARSPASAMTMMLATSLVSGLVASLFVNLTGASTVKEALDVSLLLAWFLVSGSLMLVFFENRSWPWFWISALSHVTTMAVIGVVLGLML